jgi:hypothetical protein
VIKDKIFFFKKVKILMITNSTIYIVSRKHKNIKKRNKIEELLGVTRSLLKAS